MMAITSVRNALKKMKIFVHAGITKNQITKLAMNATRRIKCQSLKK